MNWDAIGAIGEILGALAVIATLAYLATQVKSMKMAVGAESLGRAQEDVNFLIAQLLSHADLMTKADAGLELNEVEMFKLNQLYEAHSTQSFHNYARQLTINGNSKVPSRNFAGALSMHPAFMTIWVESTKVVDKDRFVRAWVEQVQDYIDRGNA